MSIYHKLSEQSIKVYLLAQEEARSAGHNFVGTEQLILGLVAVENGIASHVLKSFGLRVCSLREQVLKIIGRGSGQISVIIPETPRLKRVIQLAEEFANSACSQLIQTEHLLAGFLSEGEGVGARAIENCGVGIEQIVSRLQLHLLATATPPETLSNPAKIKAELLGLGQSHESTTDHTAAFIQAGVQFESTIKELAETVAESKPTDEQQTPQLDNLTRQVSKIEFKLKGFMEEFVNQKLEDLDRERESLESGRAQLQERMNQMRTRRRAIFQERRRLMNLMNSGNLTG